MQYEQVDILCNYFNCTLQALTEKTTWPVSDQPYNQKSDQTSEHPSDHSTDQTSEQPSDHSTDQSTDQSSEKTIEQPSDHSTVQPSDQPSISRRSTSVSPEIGESVEKGKTKHRRNT